MRWRSTASSQRPNACSAGSATTALPLGKRTRHNRRATVSGRGPTLRRRHPCPLCCMKRVLILGVNGFIGHHLSKRIIAGTDWEIYGMDMQTERIDDLLGEPRFHFFEGDITINREWIEYHVKKCDVVLPLVAIATPATYVREPLRVFELDFEANLPIVRAAVRHRKRLIFPSTSEVYGMCARRRIRPGALRTGARPDQQAALDLRLREAADGSRDPRVRAAGRPRLHAVPAVQLDRRGARLDQHAEGRQLARDHAVPRPYRARRDDQARRRRHAEARRSPTSTTASTR